MTKSREKNDNEQGETKRPVSTWVRKLNWPILEEDPREFNRFIKVIRSLNSEGAADLVTIFSVQAEIFETLSIESAIKGLMLIFVAAALSVMSLFFAAICLTYFEEKALFALLAATAALQLLLGLTRGLKLLNAHLAARRLSRLCRTIPDEVYRGWK